MINIEKQYEKLIQELLLAPKKDDRTGTGTRSVFGRTLTHDMQCGYPLLNGKRIYYKHAIVELLWILNGRTDIKYLRDNGVTYWDADYARSGRTDNNLGPVYGHQWRSFNGVDQLANLVYDIKKNPNSRRLMINAWNPADLPDMVLPPCHYGFQVYINNGTLDLMWQQRSADVFLGLPYDIAMYGLLLEMLAKGAKLKPGKLIAQLGDCHLYLNHERQALTYLARMKPSELSKLALNKGISYYKGKLEIPRLENIAVLKYNPLPAIKAPLSVGS